MRMSGREGWSLVAIVGAAMALLWSFLWWPPKVDRAMHRAVGSALAKACLELAISPGEITVLTRDTESFPQPALDVLLEQFQREVQAGGGRIVAVQRFQVDPLRPVEVPAGDFFEAIRKAPAGRVVLSLLGAPLLTPEQWARLGTIKPRIVAFCPGRLGVVTDLGRLFDAGFLHAALVERASGGSVAGGHTPGPSYAERYELRRPGSRAVEQRQAEGPR